MAGTKAGSGGRLGRSALTGQFVSIAERGAALGLTVKKSRSVSGRINPELLRLAKERTGISSESALIELALTNIVLEDGFAETFRKVRSAVDEDIELGL